MEIGLVRRVDIDSEMQQSYLDYAMSVIVSRALPDARDGLKPVQRRILFGMYDMGLRADTPFKKSARIVGEVLGKYHPHGDQSVYDAMSRLAQDFSMRYLLVDGQGNFGSVDGDPPAAMRYTEARLTKLSLELLNQIERDTIDFTRNFDDSLNEPVVLPAAFPNLLVNGASGIAVGMATSIPPHNLGEVVDALKFMLARWDRQEDIAVDDLMKFIKGPDFPTGGIILQENGTEDLLSAYATGRGKVTVRGRVQLEDMGRGKSRILITELPFQINKSSLIERIAELAREGDLEGISDLRDESDRQGMRIVIELNKVAETEKVLRELYKRTPLQSTFRINLLALVDGEPRLLALKPALRVFLEHRISVVRRRTEFDLAKAKARAHILEGLRVALKNLDEIINLIRKAADVDDARAKLIKRYSLSELQANAILEMQLRRLAALERKKIEQEYKDILALIKTYEDLLASPIKLREEVSRELDDIKLAYNDRRKTQIVALKEGEVVKDILTTNDLEPQQTVWVGLTNEGLIGRTHNESLSKPARSEALAAVLESNTHETLYLITPDGRGASLSVQSLPEVEKFSQGVHSHRVSPLADDEKVAVMVAVPAQRDEENPQYLVTVSRNGMVKKTSTAELPGLSAQVFTAVKVNAEDEIGWVFLTNGSNEIVLTTRMGMVIRFSEDSVRPMGLAAAGVNGIKLAEADEVAGAFCYQPNNELMLVSALGVGWHMPSAQLVLQGRYGQGTIACRPAKGDEVSGILYGPPKSSGVALLSSGRTLAIALDNLPLGKRAAAGKSILTLKSNEQIDQVVGFIGSSGKPERSSDTPKPRAKKTAAVVQPSLLDPIEKQPAARSKKTSPPQAAEKKSAARTGAKAAADQNPAAKASRGAAPASTTGKKRAESKPPVQPKPSPSGPSSRKRKSDQE
jgi:DNA gyrase subunit A